MKHSEIVGTVDGGNVAKFTAEGERGRAATLALNPEVFPAGEATTLEAVRETQRETRAALLAEVAKQGAEHNDRVAAIYAGLGLTADDIAVLTGQPAPKKGKR